MPNLGFLCDCISPDPSECELLIVQECAADRAKWLRDRDRQAVLRIGAAIMKVEGAPLDRVLDD
jgi:DNA gyrase/topoisomerase IV subunit B